MTAFAELSDEIRWQSTAEPTFPETVSGAVYGKPAEIPVTWQTEQDYDEDFPQRGLYVFGALPGEGYALADGVEAPRITVYIPAQRMMMRMGGGTTDSPLEITTAAQLAEIAVLVNAGRLETFLFNDSTVTVYLELQNDIDLSGYGASYNGGKGWAPIGIDRKPFKGSFDGDGHTISGLYINDTNLDNAGLFGCVSGGSITSLSLSAVNIHAGDWAGAIAGYIDGGNIEDCRGSGTVSGGSNVGGVVGWVDTSASLIKACSFAGMVSGSASWTGGVVGRVSGGLLQHSYSTATVNGNNWVGGVIGMVEDNGTVEYCYATGAVKGSECVGGIAGMNGENCILQSCAALNSDVKASASDYGRVAGSNYLGTLSGNVAFSGMTGGGSDKTADGLDGADISAADIKVDGSIATRFTGANGWTIVNGKLPGFGSAVDMPVHITDDTAPDFSGAGTAEDPYLIGTAAQLAKLAELVNAGTSPYADADVYYKLTNDINLSSYGSGWNGGKGWVPIGTPSPNAPFTGIFDGDGKTITGLYIDNQALDHAGLFGYVSGSSAVVKKLGIVNASVTGGNYVGGLVGRAYSDSAIEQCYVTGSMRGTQYAGGVAGALDGPIKNCYAAGSAATTGNNQFAGGITGHVGSSGMMQYCYATSAVAGHFSVGGIAGHVDGTVKDCAALNPSVNSSSSQSQTGRIAHAGGTLSGNAAFSDMLMNGNTVSGGTAGDKNGEGKSAAEIQGNGFFQTLFGSDSAWVYETGKLPVLSGFAAGMQDGALPAHISGEYFAGGNGTQPEPYQIATAAQLVRLAELVNAGNENYRNASYQLTADIDLSSFGASNTTFNGGKGWIPIGNNTNTTFKGSFDGNYKTISGLYINNSLYYTGLFGLADGPISNLGLTSVNITSTNTGGTGGTGGIAGITQASGIVSGCFVSGIVKGSANVGGVVGTARCAIANCYALGSVEGTGSKIGGIAGECAALSYCYAANAVSGGSTVGGIAGMTGGDLKNCAALNPSVAPNNASVRRVVSGMTGAGSILNNYAFSGMKGGGNNKWPNNLDGADFSIAQVNTAAFWTTVGNWNGGAWSGTVWTFANDKLPILSGFASGLQSGAGGLYLTERDIANATVSAGGPYTYTGSLIVPTLTVTFDGAALTKGTDYTVAVTSSDNAEGTTSAGTNPGEVTVKLIGIGSFKGEKTGVTYTIRSSDVDKDKSTVTADPTSVYIGGTDNSTVTVTLKKANGDSLGSGMTVTLSQGLGKSIITPASGGVTDSAGKATFTVTNMAAETVTYTATADGVTLTQTATVQFTHEECNFSGDGSQNAPYQIGTAAQLAKLAEQVNAGNANFNGKRYILMDNIDLSAYGESYTNLNGDEGWVPIGNYDRQFTGVFDGNGHTVYGLYANVTTMCSDNRKHAGLFGYLGAGGTAKNLGVSGSVKATESGGTSNLAGGIAGYSEGGIISNCYSTCDVMATGNSFNISGGIVGYNYNNGTITNCYAAGNISATTSNAYAGGLAGIINGATITYSYWNTDAIAAGVTQGTLGTGCEGKALASMKTQAFADALNGCPGFLPDWMKWAYSSSVNGSLPYFVKTVTNPTIELSQNSYVYDGTAKTPAVTVKDGATTIPANEYTVSYSNNTNAGTAAVILTNAAGGNYTVSGSTTFAITKAQQAALTITGKPTGAIAYGDAFTLSTAGGSGTGAVTWEVTAGGAYAAVNVNTGEVSITGVGAVTITAIKNGDTNYQYATATYSFTSVKATPNVGTVSYSGGAIYPTTPIATVSSKLSKDGSTTGTLALAAGTTFTVGTKGYTWEFTPTDGTNHTTATGTVQLTVTADLLSGIAVTTAPTKKAYVYGETFDPMGMVVTATYAGGGTKTLNTGDYTISYANGGSFSVGDTSVTLSYSDSGVTKICAVNGLTVSKAAVQSINTTVSDVSKTAYEIRNATTSQAVVNASGLPANVSITTDSGSTAILPITWSTTTAYNAKGTTYQVTGTLTGNANIDAGSVTKSVAITVTPITAVNPAFGDASVLTGSHGGSATASALEAANILHKNGSISVQGEDISYSISWSGGPLNTTSAGNNVTFTGTISYPAAPSWLTLPSSLTVSRKVTVTAKTAVTISGISTPNKTYDGAAYVPSGTVSVNGGSVPINKLVWLYTSTDGGSYSSTAAPANAGAYKLTISVPDSNANYTGSEAFTFTIEKRQITLTADNKSVIKGGSLPTLTHTSGNLAPGETVTDALSAAPTLTCPTFNGNTPGNYAITLTGGTATDNYTIATRTDGTLTVAEQTYTVTFNLNGGTRTGGGNLTQTVAEGSAATAPTVSRSNHTFTGWNKDFTNVTANLTVTAGWSYNGGGGSGGGYTPSAPSPAPIITEKQPDMPTTAQQSVTGTVKDGVLSATITEQMVKDAIKAAQDAAKKSGKEVDGIALGFNVTGTGSYTSLNASIDAGAIDCLKETGVKFVKIGSSVLDITIEAGAIAEIDKQSSGTVTVSAKPLTKLSDAARKLIGNRPVFNITVSYQKNGKTEYVSNFGKGTVTLGIAYKAASSENTGNLFGVYVDKNGKPQLLTKSSYENGRLIFSRNSLSTYGVGYKAPAPAFTDAVKHWAKDNIDFVASRNLISGTTATTFAPNTSLTRADFLMALGRLSGADVSNYKTSSFTDIKASDTAMPYIEWAVGSKIVSGYGNGKFGPTDLITREQMAVMMQNYAKATGYKLPVTREATTYADASSIGSIYKTAVTAMQQAGIMMGGTGNKFNPKASATRAEVSSMLHRYIKLTIDPATAQGWSLNDAGQWLYYKDGKALTGTQTIDGVKYFFETTGALKTGWVKDGDNWRYYSGNKAAMGWLDISDKRYYFTKDGLMVSGKWLEIDGKWYYFYADGALAKSTKVDGYEVDGNGVRKTK
ncbi:MAG: S-layer homology domain-containing protein [Clostridiaceae bacterium]|nr:S-layer homology domain-containing protein [Clostridiaceae bacterium]